MYENINIETDEFTPEKMKNQLHQKSLSMYEHPLTYGVVAAIITWICTVNQLGYPSLEVPIAN